MRRPDRVTLRLDGADLAACPGESVLAALVASGARRLRDDREGTARGAFCNMGTCSECTVWVRKGAAAWVRRRACLVPVEADLCVLTHAPEAT
ncbi:(2Fe-2S)-binding protein [Novosphingobium profundi]|uniref:2Fe-2S iron-sulfur cluster-binding protein n=1 Tax=Novosphingobium profundi TaxID=1774954 RepID=UPI001BD9488F|nr:(2Fe-2S)-binding protein [Novosphingobium profundi]